jgi:hypothetical protein
VVGVALRLWPLLLVETYWSFSGSIESTDWWGVVCAVVAMVKDNDDGGSVHSSFHAFVKGEEGWGIVT